ncbi:hypothetical protein EMCG_04553 [[Emmonsia] crescens]|uniref:Uncharacterized protein n=1 Tax=[Emmonsia] crescens TaxID=73230 RepID=A0A0G2IYP8_9EURO|nr:hypothetical protein EMCG_04553 [Emmonsia crescens UAMH 3008]
MLPARLSISQSGNIYGPPILGLRAILSDSAIQIPREELKDILEKLPDGTDSILKAVVWQIDSNPFLQKKVKCEVTKQRQWDILLMHG